MRSFIGMLFVAIALFCTTSSADEVWTYKFIVNGSRPARIDPDYGTSVFADVAGSFSFLIDWENGTGRPLQFNDHLTNLAYGTYSPSGWVLTPANEPERNHGIYLGYEPREFQNGSFIPTDGSHWEIASGNGFWSIQFTRTNAWLSVEVPIADSPVHLIDAAAVFASATIAGDHNNDFHVDASDYVALRNGGRSQVDWNVWRSYFGTRLTTPASGAAVPEPCSASLVGLSLVASLLVRGGAAEINHPAKISIQKRSSFSNTVV